MSRPATPDDDLTEVVMPTARTDRTTGQPLVAFGYQLDASGKPIRELVAPMPTGDYGSDPLGNGQFRMIPSGDIVDQDEMLRRKGLKP